MSKLDRVKTELLSLGPGEFQNLCDEYLCSIGYSNITSYGSQPGTKKTTKGTPDTYFIDDFGKYIFVEYTVQQNDIFKKIENDIDKCLDEEKTGIPNEMISEIIYCFTSSNLSPGDNLKLRKKCEEVGINLSLIGIDKLSNDLLYNHKTIIKEHLGISIDTEQVLDLDSFISNYGKGYMFAPLNNKFSFRNEEWIQIDNAFVDNNIVVLQGQSGTGKTKLALEYAKKHAEINDEKLLFIRNNGQPIFEDLKDNINNQGKYFIVVDDANQLSGLNLIVDYANKTTSIFSVKIIITVRDYALPEVVNTLSGLVQFKKISISRLSDDEISNIVKSSLEIANPDYLNRIVEIANGNIRIAILAGLLAKENNSLSAINDVSQLYDEYYSTLFINNEIEIEDSAFKTMAAIAFLDVIHLDYIEYVYDYLEKNSVSREQFNKDINVLHKYELVDICNDKAIKISDQCLSNYILKLVFYDKKLLKLSETIEVMFFNNKTKTIESINALLSVFKNEKLYEFVENEIKELWDKLKNNGNKGFWDYLKSFYRVNPVEALSIINDKIDAVEPVEMVFENLNLNETINFKYDGDDYIEILCGYTFDIENIDAAIELLFKYFSIKHDLYCKFRHYIKNGFIINAISYENDFVVQIKLVEYLINHSKDFNDEFIVHLFFEIAEEYLALSFENNFVGRHNTINIQRISASLTDGLKELRKTIWEALIQLNQHSLYWEAVYEIINNYRKSFDDNSLDVIEYDFTFIKQIVDLNYKATKQNGILAERLIHIAKHTNYNCERLFDRLIHSETMNIYRILTGKLGDDDEFDYERQKKNRRIQISNYLEGKDLKTYYKIIDICAEPPENYDISDGLQITLDFAKNKAYYLDVIKYFLKKDISYNVNKESITKDLLTKHDDDFVFELLNVANEQVRLGWYFTYFSCLPKPYVNSKNLERLFCFYNSYNCNLSKSSFLDITKLSNFNCVREDAFIEICSRIFNNFKGTFIFKIHFELMFNPVSHNAKEIMSLFDKNLKLLKDIYFHMLSNSNLYASEELLKELYSVDKSVLDDYINFEIAQKSYSNNYDLDIDNCFFSFDNFIEIYEIIITKLSRELNFPESILPYYFEKVLTHQVNILNIDNKRQDLIIYIIKNYYDNYIILNSLFETIAEHMINKQREYVKVFIDNCKDYEVFKKLPLIPSSYHWSNSAIPLYTSWIDNLEQLKPLFSGLDYLNHKRLIENKIDCLRARIKAEEIDEMVRGY